MDKTVSDGYLLIDLDREHRFPVSIRMVITAGIKGAEDPTEPWNADKVAEHIVFDHLYRLGGFEGVERFVVPLDARKLL